MNIIGASLSEPHYVTERVDGISSNTNSGAQFPLHKSSFRDALCLRYGWEPTGLPTSCVCGKFFTVDHCLSCSLHSKNKCVKVTLKCVKHLSQNLTHRHACQTMVKPKVCQNDTLMCVKNKCVKSKVCQIWHACGVSNGLLVVCPKKLYRCSHNKYFEFFW